MSFLLLLPLLGLVFPGNINTILLYLVVYLSVCFYFRSELSFKINKDFNKRRLLSSVIIGIVLSMFFYVRWLNFSVLKKVAQTIGIGTTVIVSIMTILLLVLSLPAIYKILEIIEDKLYYANFPKCTSSLKYKKFSTQSMIITSIILVVVFWLLQGRMPIYNDLDNYQNAMILNSMFSEDNYGNFVSPILAYAVKVFDFIIPTLDGYTFIMEMSILLALWLLIFTLFSICKNKIDVFTIWFVLIGVNYSINILHSNFTIISAVLSCCSLFALYAFIKKRVNLVVGILGIIVFFIGGLFRIESQLLFIPFVCLILLSDLVASDKDKTLKYLKRAIPIFVVVALCLGSNFLVDKAVASSSKYKEAVTFSNNRSNLFDYETKSYEQVSKQLSELGVSKNDYNATKQSFLADTDIFTSKYLESINDVVSLNKNSNSLNDLVDTVYNVVTNLPIVVLEFFAYFVFLVYFINLKKLNRLRIIEMILSMIGSLVIIAYFYLSVGRLPWYLLSAILFGNWFVLLSVLTNNESDGNTNKNTYIVTYLLLAISVMYAITCSANADTINNGKILDAVKAKPTVNFTDSVNHNKYVWETSSYNKYIKKTFYSQNTLPSSKFICNNIPDKKSFYGQVYYNDYLQNIGMKNPVKSLLNKNAFYVCEKSNLDLMFNFIKEHYDSSIKVKQVDKISNIPVWKFIR